MSRIEAFARDELGLKLNRGQRRAAREWERAHYQQAVLRWGRRAGKSTWADVVALFDATMRDQLRSMMRPGETRVTGIVAPTLQQASRHILACRQLVAGSKRLTALLVSETGDELVFSNGSTIRAYACSARSMRGDSMSCVVLDEIAHFVSTEDGNASGDRVLEAVQPSLAQFGDQGWLIAISTPRWRQGAFARMVEQAESGRYPYMMTMHLSTEQANERIDKKWLRQQQLEDADMYAREYLAMFVDGASAYLSSEDVIGCLRASRTLPPRPGVSYVGALDPAFSGDNFSMAIGHKTPDGSVVDGLWVWHRAGHEVTLNAVADVARAYGVAQLRTDQHAAVPIQEGLAARGLRADYQPWTNESKANAFSALKIALNTRAVELPADEALVAELCGLEARPTAGGFTRIAAAGSGHDDRAVATASVVFALTRPAKVTRPFFAGVGVSGGWNRQPETTYGGEPRVSNRFASRGGRSWIG